MFQLKSHAWGHINHRLKPLNKTNIVSLVLSLVAETGETCSYLFRKLRTRWHRLIWHPINICDS